MDELLKELCALPGVSGWEDPVRQRLKEEAERWGAETREDALGNLLVFKPGRRKPNKTVVLTAHMDEVGVVVRSADQDGFLKFAFVGGVDRRVVIGKRVWIGPGRVPGVIGMKPIHLTTAEERKTMPPASQLYIDIGAKSREEALTLVSPGDFGTFAPECLELAGGLVCAKALDDRVGCWVLSLLLREALPFDLWFVFTVQEEVGCRGAFGAAFSLRPDIAILLEGTTAADAPPAEGGQVICRPGCGPVIPFLDGGTVYDRGLIETICRGAEALGMAWQTKTRIAGGTDGRAYQRTAEGCRVAAISAAIRYIHSPSSVGCLRDFDDMRRLLLKTLEIMEENHEV